MEPLFRVYNTKLRRWMTTKDFVKLGRKYGLMWPDIEDFFVSRDGALVLLDECGNYAYMPPEMKAVFADEYKNHPKAHHNLYRHNHVCASCSLDGIKPGVGCINCRHTGMDQMPCINYPEPCPGPRK